MIRHICEQEGIPFGRQVRGDVFHLEQQAKGCEQVADEEDQGTLCVCD